MTPLRALDRVLVKRGFVEAPVRRAAVFILVASSCLLLAGLLARPWTLRLFWLGVGAALSAWNFVSLAWFIQRAFQRREKARGDNRGMYRTLLAGQILGMNLRLFITGLLVYIFLVIFSADVIALLAGLSLTVLVIPFALPR